MEYNKNEMEGCMKEGIEVEDITHSIHECSRYLFLAKVHIKQDVTVIPKVDDDPETLLELILNESSEQLRILFMKEDVLFLKGIIKKIKNGKWADLEIENIEKAQEILNKFLRIIRKKEDEGGDQNK